MTVALQSASTERSAGRLGLIHFCGRLCYIDLSLLHPSVVTVPVPGDPPDPRRALVRAIVATLEWQAHSRFVGSEPAHDIHR